MPVANYNFVSAFLKDSKFVLKCDQNSSYHQIHQTEVYAW